MTEEQIERRAERMMDHLDRRLMSDRTYSQAQYDKDVADLDRWTKGQMALARNVEQVTQ